jgi:hypothetical protein
MFETCGFQLLNFKLKQFDNWRAKKECRENSQISDQVGYHTSWFVLDLSLPSDISSRISFCVCLYSARNEFADSWCVRHDLWGATMHWTGQAICRQCKRGMQTVATIDSFAGSPSLVAFQCPECGVTDSVLVCPKRIRENTHTQAREKAANFA